MVKHSIYNKNVIPLRSTLPLLMCLVLCALHHSPVLLNKTLEQSLTINSPKRGLATIYFQLNWNKLAQVFSFRPHFSFVLAYL